MNEVIIAVTWGVGAGIVAAAIGGLCVLAEERDARFEPFSIPIVVVGTVTVLCALAWLVR